MRNGLGGRVKKNYRLAIAHHNPLHWKLNFCPGFYRPQKSVASPSGRGIATGYTGPTPLFPEVVVEIDTNPGEFLRGYYGVGHVWSLTRQCAQYGMRRICSFLWTSKSLKVFSFRGEGLCT